MILYDIYECGHVHVHTSSEREYKTDKNRLKWNLKTYCSFCGFVRIINILPEERYRRRLKLLTIKKNNESV